MNIARQLYPLVTTPTPRSRGARSPSHESGRVRMISQGGRGKRVFETRRVYSLKGLEEAAPRERLTTIIRPGVPTSPPSMHQQRKRKRNSVGLSKGNKPPPMPPRHEQGSDKSPAMESKHRIYRTIVTTNTSSFIELDSPTC